MGGQRRATSASSLRGPSGRVQAPIKHPTWHFLPGFPRVLPAAPRASLGPSLELSPLLLTIGVLLYPGIDNVTCAGAL